MDEKKHPTQPEAPLQNDKTEKGPRTQAKQAVAGASRRVLNKRWLYPAIYLGAAALIIGLMYVRSQMTARPTLSDTGTNTGSTATQTATGVPSGSTYSWPVASSITPVIEKGFFSSSASPKQQAQDLVHFGNQYSPHLGYDIQQKDGKPFTVTAAIAGQVLKVANSPLNHYTVEIQSNDGHIEKYESLSKVDVKVGESVSQGETIGTSGTSVYEASAGNHLYFEIDNATGPVNPASLLPKL